MVTRRAVLKGTAAASIGAIAAAHGATPVEANFSAGYGQLAGGAVGGFYKYRDAFQIAVKFHKIAAEVFFKEQISGGVAVFFKFFHKEWTTFETQQLSASFPDLKTTDLYFSKIETERADFFLKNEFSSVQGSVGISKDGIFSKFEEVPYNPDGNTCFPDGQIG
jgi:hypothetical protein